MPFILVRTMQASEALLGSILYVSRSRASAEEVRRIAVSASRNNALRQITGGLLWTGRHFVQVLEGSLPAVTAALRLISGDARHDGIRILDQRRVEARRFGAWGMALVVDPEADAFIVPLAAGHADASAFIALRERLHALVLQQHGGVLPAA